MNKTQLKNVTLTIVTCHGLTLDKHINETTIDHQ